ncbi:MAG: hypothetical protein AUK63_672 [bacterium P3]|nr:MAG: hypothetical protein AUK63_672 [bacterium P3]KWW42155.1 MAG: hypothetical protein F083_494 [bacterium F083]
MNKGVKLTLISLGSLLGLVLIVVGVALWLVFTPSRLTAIVNRLSAQYIPCESRFQSVDLTLFSTYPDLGLELRDVALLNHLDGAPGDTLLYVGRLVVGIDLKAYLTKRNIIVRQLQLNDSRVNLFVDADGRANYDIFPASDDTAASTFVWPDSILLHSIAIRNLQAQWVDRLHQTEASVSGLDVTAEGALTHGKLQALLEIGCGRLAFAHGQAGSGMTVRADGVAIRLDAAGDNEAANGRLTFTLPQAQLCLAGREYCTYATASHGDLIALDAPLRFSFDNRRLMLDTASLTLDGRYRVDVDGTVELPQERQPICTDLAFSTNRWDVSGLLALLPAEYTAWRHGMSLDAVAQLDGSCKGAVADSIMPQVDVTLRLSEGYWADSRLLPGPVRGVAGTVTAQMRPAAKHAGRHTVAAQVRKLRARWQNSEVVLDAESDDLTGRVPFSAHLKAHVQSTDVALLLPDTLPVTFSGMADLDVNAHATLSQVQRQDWQHIQAQVSLALADVAVQNDSLHVSTPGITLDARLLDGGVAPALAFNIATAMLNASHGIIGLNSRRLSLSGRVCYDPSHDELLDMLQPALAVNLQEASVYTPAIQQVLRLNTLRLDYADGRCDTIDASLVCGLSDYQLSGHVDGIEDYLLRDGMLQGKLRFTSNYTDVDQLMSLFNGLGTDKDSLDAQRAEAPATADPFIVPKNVNIALNTHISNCLAFGNRLSDVAGGLTVNDGTVVLDQMGFVCKAARMQLTGVYRSPRFNHLFLGLDFHLLDIQIDELIDMIPTIDTLVPMLKSFKGNADFHLAAETYLTAGYKPKMSTMLGAAAISGKDLVVLDNETFDKISSLLMFKKKTENKIDSLDVEMTVFRNELEVFPFLLSMDKYQVCVAGRHTLDNRCNYHLELLKSPLPVRLAVDVKGSLSKPKIELGKVRYANLFKPEKQNKVQERTMEIKRQVRQSLERNVR